MKILCIEYIFMKRRAKKLHSLPDFLASIRAANSLEEERQIISEEVTEMRNLSKTMFDSSYRPNLVIKLISLYVMGYNISWGYVEIVNLMNNERFSGKRIGYLAARLLLDETHEIRVLFTQTVFNDLRSPNHNIKSLALKLIACSGSTELCRSSIADIQKIISLPNEPYYIYKYALMAIVRILFKCPDYCDSIISQKTLLSFFNHKSHSVVSAAILVTSYLIKLSPKFATSMKSYALPFTKQLQSVLISNEKNEYILDTINDPFLQCRLIELISFIHTPSEEIDSIIISLTSSLPYSRPAGRTILAAIARHAHGLLTNPSILTNQVGHLFRSKDPNVIFTALSLFSSLLFQEINSNTDSNQFQDWVIDRSSINSISLQRYQETIINLISHKDPSIRHQALNVACALVDGNNASKLIPLLLQLVKQSPKDFRQEVIGKLYTVIQRFGPTPEYIFESVFTLMAESGPFIGYDIITNFCYMILKTPSLHSYALNRLKLALLKYSSSVPLIQSAVFIIGELENQIESNNLIEIMLSLYKLHTTTIETRCYLLTAITKLSIRQEKINDVIQQFKELQKLAISNHLELQQRFGEYINLLEHHSSFPDILAGFNSTLSRDSSISHFDSFNNPDILYPEGQISASDSLSMEKTSEISDITSQQKTFENNNSEIISEMKKEYSLPPGAIEGYKTSDYVLFFELQQNSNNTQQWAVRVTVCGLEKLQLTNFTMQFGVPNGWLIHAMKPSSDILEAKGGNPIRQVLILESRSEIPLKMRIQISFIYHGQTIKENVSIGDIFQKYFNK